MPAQREQYELWIDEFLQPHYPELVPRLLEALEAFDAAMESGVLTDEQLAVIVECASSPRAPLGENVAALLGELASRFSSAAQVVRELAAYPNLHVRMNALVAISSTSPVELHDEVLRIALKDRNSKVKTLAADKIMQFGLDHLLPSLEEAVRRESDANTKSVLEYERDLLLYGYHLRFLDDGRVWMTCRLPGGGTTGTFVTTTDLQHRGAKAIARSLGGEVKGEQRTV
jgi:hypothetical protein